jgi:hypothetical protein
VAAAAKYQSQPPSMLLNYQPPSTPSNFRPPFPVSRKFQSSSDGFIASPRTPITRNRNALPGLNNRNNRGW